MVNHIANNPEQWKLTTLAIYIPFAYLGQMFMLDSEALFAYALLLLIDTFTGFAKTISLGQSPTSRRLIVGVISKISMLIIPIVLALGAKGIGKDFSPLIDTVIYVLILSEIYSIIANIYTIKTRKTVEEFDAISLILRRIRTLLINTIGDGKDNETK